MINNRISVIGISGAGKSTFARQLGVRTSLPLYHMDTLFWKAGWEEVPEKEWRQKEAVILKKRNGSLKDILMEIILFVLINQI